MKFATCATLLSQAKLACYCRRKDVRSICRTLIERACSAAKQPTDDGVGGQADNQAGRGVHNARCRAYLRIWRGSGPRCVYRARDLTGGTTVLRAVVRASVRSELNCCGSGEATQLRKRMTACSEPGQWMEIIR